MTFSSSSNLRTYRQPEDDLEGAIIMANEPRDINFVVRGTDVPTLVFCSWTACSLEDWEEQITGLSPRFRCGALDLPSHGASTKPETIDIESLGSAANWVKDRIAAPSTILVGHRMAWRGGSVLRTGAAVLYRNYQDDPCH